jgi:uncharacterized protein (TIGR00266 family)
MEFKVHGTVMQAVEFQLGAGEMVYSQTHRFMYMNPNIMMGTNTGGGLFAGFRRALSGGTFFRSEFSAPNGNGIVAFSSKFPGKIIAKRLAPGESLICRKDSFLCAESTVQFDIAFSQRIGTGLFGGEGFILQRVTGPGVVCLELSGEVMEKILQPGETLRVHVGHVAVQDPSIQFTVQMVKGFKNLIFGDGLFFAALTGPGRVLLQTMPIVNLAEEILKYSGNGGQERSQGVDSASGFLATGASGLGAVGGIMESLLDN